MMDELIEYSQLLTGNILFMYFVMHITITTRGKYFLHTSEIPRCPVEGKFRGSFPRILFMDAVEEDHMKWIFDLALISRIGLSL